MAARKVDSKWFQDRLADKQISQRGFAKMIDMDPAALSYAIKGTRAWKHDELVAFATIVGVPYEEAVSRAGLALPTGGKGMCNVVGHVDATGELRTGQVEAPRRVPAPPEAPEGTVAARFKTPMTGAELMDGWLIYYVDGVKRVPPEAAGRLCVAWLSNHGRALVGVVRRGYERGTHTLHPWTPGAAAYENISLERASPVLWIRCGG
jgi:hypothetical protein